jgi:hypothetical protein
VRLPPRKKKTFPSVFPTDPVGAEFCKWFWSNSRGWNFIRSDLPAPGEKARWTTEPYPIQPDELWLRHADPNELLGVCFKKFTRYIVIDLDRGSKYHPLNDEAKYAEILAVLRDIGLNCPVVIRSSWSEGLHVYYPLPKAISSFGVASAVKWTLFDHGILLGDGQLETFPNTKSYGTDGNFVQYKCHRLPLQPESGSFLLDATFEPYSDSVEDLLDEFNTAAAKQNLELLKQVLAVSWFRQALSRGFGSSGRVETWRRHLERRISTGWTAFSQTNGLIKDIATYGRVFVRLNGRALIDYTVQTVKSAPGYEQFCRHQHEIHRRVSDWSRCVEAYYWPYGSEPGREGTYADHFHRELANDCPPASNNIVSFNATKSAEAQERIRLAVAHLESSGNLPETATARSYAIIAASKLLTGIGISQTTLHKPKYLALWHPAYYHPQEKKCVIDSPEPNTAVSSEQEYPILPDPWDEPELPETAQKQALPNNYTPTAYMKGCGLSAFPLLLPAQSKVQDSHVEINLSNSSQIQINLSKPSEPRSYKQYLYSGETTFDDFSDKQPLSVDESENLDSRQLTTDAPTTSTASLPHCPGVGAPPAPTEPAATEDFRQVAMLRVQALAHAQRSVKNQVLTSSRLIRGSERAHLEQVARMQFYWQSGSPTLLAEALAWASANPGCIPEIDALALADATNAHSEPDPETNDPKPTDLNQSSFQLASNHTAPAANTPTEPGCRQSPAVNNSDEESLSSAAVELPTEPEPTTPPSPKVKQPSHGNKFQPVEILTSAGEWVAGYFVHSCIAVANLIGLERRYTLFDALGQIYVFRGQIRPPQNMAGAT